MFLVLLIGAHYSKERKWLNDFNFWLMSMWKSAPPQLVSQSPMFRKVPGPVARSVFVKGFLNLRDILQTFTGLHVLVKYLDSETYNHIKLKWFGNGKTILFHVDLSYFDSICAVGYHRNEFDMKDKYEKVCIYVFPTVHLLKPRQACSKMNKYLKG